MTVEFRGFPACECLAAWLPQFEAELKARGLVVECIDVAQLIGRATKSALVHSTGGAADIWQIDWQVSWVARQMGCVMWPRVTGSFADGKHSHGVLVGCPHLHEQGRAQIREAFGGGDGLLGSAPDDVRLAAALVPGRTWQQGIVWHRAQARARRRAALTARIVEAREARSQLTAKILRLRTRRDAIRP